MTALNPIDRVRALLRDPPSGAPPCLVCGRHVEREETSVRLRGGGLVHRECATYRMRQVGSAAVRLGPPRR